MNENVSLTEQHLDILDDITQIALQNVTQSLSTLLKDEILVKKSSFGIEKVVEDLNKILVNSPNSKILFTEIVGQIRGKSYVFIDDDSEEIICNLLLPDSVIGQIEMREGIALEFDNILIAALVTKFSNLLNISEMHGHVPQYNQENTHQIIEDIQSGNYPYLLNTRIQSFKKGINLNLLVMLDSSMTDLMNDFSKEDSFVGKQQEKENEEKKGTSFFKKIFHI